MKYSEGFFVIDRLNAVTLNFDLIKCFTAKVDF